MIVLSCKKGQFCDKIILIFWWRKKMTLNNLQDTIYNFVSQNKIFKMFIDVSDYIVYAFVVLYFISKLISFSSLFDAILYYLFFILFIAAAIGKKYIAIIALLVNNIICSSHELISAFITSRYSTTYFYITSNSVWKIGISIFLDFFLCFLFLFILKKENSSK